MMTVNKLILEIQEKFKNSCPNGMLLGWDLNRFYDSLLMLFAGYSIKNQTDFNYSYCNSYDIELHTTGTLGQHYQITFKISFIVNAYTIYLVMYSKNKKQGKVISNDKVPEAQICIEKIKKLMKQNEFQEINNEFDIVVDNIKLELSEVATIGKCLFDDF